MSTDPKHLEFGPFRASSLNDGDRYELSHGHAIYCSPAGGTHARATVAGSLVIDTDPDVVDAAIDAGFTTGDGSLRGTGISVGVPDVPGWVQGTPPLAIEYAGVGQDEAGLQSKIAELLAAGTRFVWVVRLVGLRRVEVHAHDGTTRVVDASGTLTAPGILRNPVPVVALYDRDEAQKQAFENLLGRRGYATLEDVLEEGREEGLLDGRRAALIETLVERFGPLPDAAQASIGALDLAGLKAMNRRALSAPDLAAVLAGA